LIIFDNADSVDNKTLLAEFRPTGGLGSILITSRDTSLLDEFGGQILTRLSVEEAPTFLWTLTYAGDRDVDWTDLGEEIQAAENLVKLVDCLPLAITQLASTAIETNCFLSDLDSKYNNFSQLIEDSHYGYTITGAPSQYVHSLETVLDTSYNNLDRNQRDLLNILSFLDPDKIQFDLLTGSIADIGQQQHEVFQTASRLIQAKSFLLSSSLLYENATLSFNWMHRLVQSTCQLRMLKTNLESRQKAFESGLNLVHKAFPVPPLTGGYARRYWAAQEGYLAHIQMLAATVESSHQNNTPLTVDPARYSKLLHDAAW
jgi:hypothetical protein